MLNQISGSGGILFRFKLFTARSNGARQSIESYLAELTGTVYGKIIPATVLCRVKALRHQFPDLAEANAHPKQVLKVLRKEWNLDCRRRRATFVPVPPIYECLQKTIVQAQRLLVGEVASKDVVFEINPSSNHATSDIDDLTQHPFFSIRENGRNQGKNVRITINCDDPGTFATRLENEYALMSKAIEQNFGTSAVDSPVQMIKEMIQWAREATFQSDRER